MSADLNINVNLDGRQALSELQAMRTALAEMSHQSRLAGLRDELRLVQSETAMIRDRFAQVDRQIRESTSATGQWRQTVTAISSSYTAMRSVIGDAAAAARHVVEGAVNADRHERAVRQLGEAYNRVRDATNETVTAEQALRVQQELTQSGLRVGANELATITRRAREYAVATGVDVDQALGQMTEALRGGTAEGLRRFGVSVSEGTDRVHAMESALSRWRSEQSRSGPAARTLGEEVSHASSEFSNMSNSIMGSIARALRLREAFASISGFMGGWDRERQQNEREESAGNAEILRNRTRTQFFQQLQAAGARGEVRGFQYDRLMGIAERANTSSLQRLAIALQQGRGQAAYRGVVDSDVMEITGSQGAQDTSRAGGGGGENPLAGLNTAIARIFGAQARIAQFTGPSGPGADTRRFPGEPAAAYATRIANLAQTLEDSAGQYEQQSQSYWQRVASNRQFSEQHGAAVSGAQRELASANSAAAEQRGLMGRVDRLGAIEQGDLDAQIRNGARLTDETVRNAERMGDAAYQMGAAFTDVFGRSQTLAQGTAGLFRTAMGSMTQSFRSHIGALITGRETIGEALKGMLHETLLSLAQESAVRAIMETAHGIAAVATFRYPQAAAHFAAAGVYTGVAVAAGVGAAITAPPQAAASAGSSMGSDAGTRLGPSRAANDNAGGGNQTFVLNFQSALITREDAQDVVVRAAQGAFNRNARIEQISQLQRARAAA